MLIISFLQGQSRDFERVAFLPPNDRKSSMFNYYVQQCTALVLHRPVKHTLCAALGSSTEAASHVHIRSI